MTSSIEQGQSGLLKRCSRCGEIKPLECFSRDKKRRDGLQPQCKACYREWRDANPDKVRENHRRHYELNSEDYKSRARQWREENPERKKETDDRWRNENHERKKAKGREYTAANPHVNVRNKRAKGHVPSWADQERIAEIYRECRWLNEIFGEVVFHVDHIIPLRGKDVCGLHVHINLQILPASENRRKGRSWR